MPAFLVITLLLSGSLPARAAESIVVREAQTNFQNVIVKPGDTLWGISHAYLKDPARWDEILKYNHLPTEDPTVALPGMTLRVPIRLIKTSLRAAHVVFQINKVLLRRKDSASWKDSKMAMEVFQGDSLRTLEESRARVMFLNKELLNLEQNSMAVIKPSSDPDADVVLKAGSVFAGHARIVTSTARITPRTGDTRYSATVEANMTTRVEVFKGAAAVAAQGSQVEVPAGMQTRVALGLAPELPKPLENLSDLEERAQEFASAATVGGGAAPEPNLPPPQPEPEADADNVRSDIQVLKIGEPIQGYHVQASEQRDFKRLVFDRKYGVDDRFAVDTVGIKAGAYWWRVSAIDLLGTEGRYHEPHYYTVGIKRADPENERLASMVTLISPEENAEVSDSVRVAGILRDERLTVEVNGRPVRIDEEGNFAVVMKVQVGGSSVLIKISDGKGNATTISRHVIRL
ncbi:MAG: LysM peptidoglycan-binding domain-containing protein [Elusimicrobiota bacterium]